ncbi:MAG: GH116 family glycosyl hydrolase [Anaerolineae bacterium]
MVPMPNMLFQAVANRSKLQEFTCLGYDRPVLGTIYPRSSLRWHGVPLGGLGCGYVCWDPDGRLSQCTLFSQVPNSSQVPVLNSIPFRLKVGGRSYELAMRGDDGRGDLADLSYFGHYPVADVCLVAESPIIVEVRAFAPWLPGDAAESNTPAVVFDVWLSNSGAEPEQVELTFTSPAVPKPFVTTVDFNSRGWQGLAARHPWDKASPRMGAQPLEHELALAAEIGRVECSGSTLTSTFSASLAPGERAHNRLVLAWYQPHLRDSWNRAERLRYADRFNGAQAVAEYAIDRHSGWLERIIAWQSAIYARTELSPELREALLNSFYATCKNSHWITRARPDDWFPADGLLLVNESLTTCPLSETLPCHYYGSLPVLLFFPELERTALEAYRHYQLASGEVPFSFDKGFGARAPNYQTQHTNGINEYIELVYRYYLRTGDHKFLREFYPSVRAAGRYVEFLDSDNDGLVNEQAHALPGEFWPANVPWDTWPQRGTSVFTGLKTLSACAALIAMAERENDQPTKAKYRDRYARGQKSLQDKLWNGAYFDLQMDDNDQRDSTCLSAQLTGAWACALLGLPSPLPADQLGSALQAVHRLNGVQAPYGLVLAAGADSSYIYANQTLGCDLARDVWPLFNFIYAATCRYLQQEQDSGDAAAQQVLEALFRAANAMPWGWPCSINPFDGWIGHGHDYNDPQAIWSLPLAIAGLDLAHANQPGTLVAEILAAANPR